MVFKIEIFICSSFLNWILIILQMNIVDLNSCLFFILIIEIIVILLIRIIYEFTDWSTSILIIVIVLAHSIPQTVLNIFFISWINSCSCWWSLSLQIKLILHQIITILTWLSLLYNFINIIIWSYYILVELVKLIYHMFTFLFSLCLCGQNLFL